ncbi:AraC family transcriptional regulator [Chitinophaga barathri]|uniref:AraC family transcriptional regulator n=1 Tax=Chitinophaga barathri TaxID=1647451 RepID=A0A3N4MPG6_9BACT|nr:AraC family transcriptional regulator [Chitinophaga barathri]RPD41980.1 AraC family transcriptional regulator [Chitinophaga barathri]
MKQTIPVYDICTISAGHQHQDLLAERLEGYLKKNYQRVHQQHGHNFYHLVLFTKGNGEHTLDFTRYTVQPWQIYFMTPGQVHSWHFKEGTDGYVIHFSASFFHAFLMQHQYLEHFPFFSGNSKEQVLNIPANGREEVKAVFEQVLKEAAGANEADMIRVLLLQLFLLVNRVTVKEPKKAVPQQKQLVLRNFRQLINKHYRRLRLPKEYAELMYITPNHLNALCQDLLGKTAGELIRERVLLEAKRMLTNEDLTVTQIATDLNFEDNSYFSRFFKKYEGITPEEFRNSLI